MKKLLFFFFIVLVASLYGITQFVPIDYEQIFIAKDNATHYSLAKNTQLVDILANSLGIEPMIQGFLASSLVQYGATAEQLTDLISKDVMIVTKKDNIAIIVGPSSNALKLLKAVTEILGANFQAAVSGSYLLISTDKEFLEQCLKGGGTIPEEILEKFSDSSVWAVLFSPRISMQDSVFSLKGTIKVFSDKISGEYSIYPENDKARDLLKGMKSTKEFNMYTDPNLGGEIFIFANVGNFSVLSKLYQSLNLSSTYSNLFSNMETFLPEGTKTENLEGQFEELTELSDKLTGQFALSLKISNMIEAFLFSEEDQQIPNPVLYAVVGGKISIEELNQITNGQIKVDSGIRYIDLEGIYITSESDRLKVYSTMPAQFKNEKGSLEKALSFYKSDMPLFIFVDFSPILEKLTGITVDSILLLTSSVNDKIFTVNWYLK
jgi:hypothetical protein